MIISQMRKHRSASGITAFNSMIYAAGGMSIVKLFSFKIQNDSETGRGVGSESEELWL